MQTDEEFWDHLIVDWYSGGVRLPEWIFVERDLGEWIRVVRKHVVGGGKAAPGLRGELGPHRAVSIFVYHIDRLPLAVLWPSPIRRLVVLPDGTTTWEEGADEGADAVIVPQLSALDLGFLGDIVADHVSEIWWRRAPGFNGQLTTRWHPKWFATASGEPALRPDR